MFEQFLLAGCLIATILLAGITAFTFSIAVNLHIIRKVLIENQEYLEKIFKLIRYRRSQEVLDFLNKKADVKGRK